MGTGILLCLSGDYRQHAQCGDFGSGACEEVTTVPLTVALNGQQYTMPSLNYNFYRTPVIVNNFDPASGPLLGGTETIITGVNFFDTGIIKCKWGADRSAEAPAQYVEGKIVCTSPDVAALDVPYESGDFGLQVALNGAQSSTTPASFAQPLSFFFYSQPRVQQVVPDFGTYLGGTAIALTALPDAPFVDPAEDSGGPSQIRCKFRVEDETGVETIAFVSAGVFDMTNGQIECSSPTAPHGMVVHVEVALNGQQYTHDQTSFSFTPVVTALDIITGPTSGNTVIHVIGSGFKDVGAQLMCRFLDPTGSAPDQFRVAEQYVDNSTIICKSPTNDGINPYPNMFPTLLEISMDACELGIEAGTEECPFGDHYSVTAKGADWLTQLETGYYIGNQFSYYSDP
eukprot:COSAG05_NODE_4490_length_1492_cov_1.042355_2_plen_398_part_01